jgi:hypothetical protein
MATPVSTRLTSCVLASLALLMLTGACGEDVAPVPEQPPREQSWSACPPPPPLDMGAPLKLTCADAPELCAEDVTLHPGTSPLGVVDLLFIPEGFTEAQLPAFREEVDFHVQTLLAHEPFASYRDRLTFRRLDLVSASDDLYNPDVSDTVLGTCGQWTKGRLLYDFERIRLAASGRAPVPTVAIVVPNETRFTTTIATFRSSGGLAYVLLARGADPTVLARELGHSLFFLGDEYGNRFPDTCWPEEPPAFSTADHEFYPNLTLDRTGARWAHIVQGVERGGHGYGCGVFNPPGLCMMGEDVTQPPCAVCRAHIDALFAGFAGQDDGPPRCELALDKLPSELRGTVQVSGRFMDYNGVQRWEVRLDDTLVSSGTRLETGFRGGVVGGPHGVLNTRLFPNGPHTLRLSCTDSLGNSSVKEVAVRIHNRTSSP